jgi:hypothetical protein
MAGSSTGVRLPCPSHQRAFRDTRYVGDAGTLRRHYREIDRDDALDWERQESYGSDPIDTDD